MTLSEYIEWLSSWEEDMDKIIGVEFMPFEVKIEHLTIYTDNTNKITIDHIYEENENPGRLF